MVALIGEEAFILKMHRAKLSPRHLVIAIQASLTTTEPGECVLVKYVNGAAKVPL